MDLLFHRWPVQLLWPLSNWGLGLGLIGWHDLVPTLLLYAGTAAAVFAGAAAPWVAAATLAVLATYIAWRARHRGPLPGILGWLTHDWAARSPGLCRWLTGDFIT